MFKADVMDNHDSCSDPQHKLNHRALVVLVVLSQFFLVVFITNRRNTSLFLVLLFEVTESTTKNAKVMSCDFGYTLSTSCL